MKTCKAYSILAISLITMLLMPLITSHVSSTETTTIQQNPKEIQSPIGQSVTVNITVTNVDNLNTWQLYILFNPTILTCIEMLVPQNNIFKGHDTFFFVPIIDNSAGSILAMCALAEPVGVTGSGVLCQIIFSGKALGITPLIFANKMEAPIGTYLQTPNYNFIPFDASDGMIKVTAPGFQEYLFEATQNSKTYKVLILSNSTVSSFNYDQYLKTMTFNAAGTDGTRGFASIAFSKELFTGTIAVLVGEEAVYGAPFENQTYNFLHFNYSHSTKNIKIFLTLVADVNGDRMVDMADISIIIDAFLTSPGDPLWNPLTDVNHDNIVDMADISIAIDNFLKTWSP